MYLKIIVVAFKNIFRNKRRTMLTFSAIVCGIVALVIFGGFVEYTFWGLRETTIHSQLGHIQIYKKGYSDKGIANPSEYLITNYPEIKRVLSTVPHIDLITPQISFSGLVGNGQKTLTCSGKGVMLGEGSKLASFESIVEGNELDNEQDVLIGKELYKTLGVKVGDYATLLTTTIDGSINAADVKIAGVTQTGSSEYDAVSIKMPLNSAQKLLATDSVEKIVILLEDTKYTDETADKINEIFKKQHFDLELKKWSDLATFYHSVENLYNGIFSLIKVIIAVIVFFSIANTMTMAVFERTTEIGTIRAMGMTKSSVVFLFLCEGILIGILGGGLGVLGGMLVAKIINLCGGIYIPPPPMMNEGYSAIILIVPKVIISAYSSAVIVSTVSSLYPVIRAAKLDVVDALRHT